HKKRTEDMIAALELGLKHAETKHPKPPEKDVDTATAMLVYSELTGGKYKEAVAAGEKMVRQKPLAVQAAAVATYTLQAYGQLLAHESKLDEEEEEQYRKKMEALAKYVADRWPSDPAADIAHFQMGLLLIRDKKYPEAVDELASIKSSFGA